MLSIVIDRNEHYCQYRRLFVLLELQYFTGIFVLGVTLFGIVDL
jgi:hypothetical protein